MILAMGVFVSGVTWTRTAASPIAPGYSQDVPVPAHLQNLPKYKVYDCKSGTLCDGFESQPDLRSLVFEQPTREDNTLETKVSVTSSLETHPMRLLGSTGGDDSEESFVLVR